MTDPQQIALAGIFLHEGFTDCLTQNRQQAHDPDRTMTALMRAGLWAADQQAGMLAGWAPFVADEAAVWLAQHPQPEATASTTLAYDVYNSVGWWLAESVAGLGRHSEAGWWGPSAWADLPWQPPTPDELRSHLHRYLRAAFADHDPSPDPLAVLDMTDLSAAIHQQERHLSR